MKQYLDLMRLVREHGTFKSDRTGTGTYSMFGHQMRFDLADGFPLVTTKKCHLKSIIHELLWFLQGDTNIRYLVENGVHIWTDWPLKKVNDTMSCLLNKPISAEEFERAILDSSEFARSFGDLGPVYGYQWRSWPAPDGRHIDQIANVVDMIKTNPDSRRLIVSAWNPALIDEMALPPCHVLFQFYSRELGETEARKQVLGRITLPATEYVKVQAMSPEGRRQFWLDHTRQLGLPTRKLSCQLYQRSADIFLGIPFNIASYALLTMMVAQVTGHAPGEFIWTGGDCHLYANHLEQADLQLSREPLPLPAMQLNPAVKDLFAFRFEDFELVGYQPHPHIKAPVAV